MQSLLASPAVFLLLSLVFGGVMYAAVGYATKASRSPTLARIRTQYPVFNLVLAAAGPLLANTDYKTAYDIAFKLWQGQGMNLSQAQDLASTMLKKFDVEKYLGTDLTKLSTTQIQQGEAIARALFPEYTPGTVAAIAQAPTDISNQLPA